MHRMKTRIRFLFISLLILPIFSFANPHNLPLQLDVKILQGKTYLYQFKIKRASRIFSQLIKEFPEYPHPYFYKSYVTLIVYSQDMTNDSLFQKLNQQVDVAIQVAKKYAEKYPGDPDAQFHLGLSYGIKGVTAVLNQSYFKGYINGRRAKNYLQKVVKMDSTYYDAYLGLGVFHYYVDLLGGIVKFFANLLGFEGSRELGKKEIRLTATNGHFFKEEANFTYQIIRYFLEGDKINPIVEFNRLHRKFPTNPALTLILGYHYRRSGYIQTAIQYFNAVPDSFSTTMPQIFNIKIYNLGVCHFFLNHLQKAEAYFDRLLLIHTRKTPFYQAAIAFYKGLLADLKFDHTRALYYYRKIYKNKQAAYWYYNVQIFKKYPMDRLMKEYVLTENLFLSRRFQEGRRRVINLLNQLEQDSPSDYNCPDLPFMVRALVGEYYFILGDFKTARKFFDEIYAQIDQFHDQFYRSWFFIYYGRCLMEIGNFPLAGKMLQEAKKIDDDYTKLIANREEYILKQKILLTQKEE